MSKQKSRRLDFVIDKLTNSILNTISGETVLRLKYLFFAKMMPFI